MSLFRFASNLTLIGNRSMVQPDFGSRHYPGGILKRGCWLLKAYKELHTEITSSFPETGLRMSGLESRDFSEYQVASWFRPRLNGDRRHIDVQPDQFGIPGQSCFMMQMRKPVMGSFYTREEVKMKYHAKCTMSMYDFGNTPKP